MSLSDWASPIDFTPSTNNLKRNKTIKNIPARKIDKDKFTKLLNTNKKYDDDSDSDSDMADFTPPPKPVLSKESIMESPNSEYDATSPPSMQSNPVYAENIKQE